MNLPVPKNNGSKLPLPHLPALPSIFAHLLPVVVPQLTYKPGVTSLVESFIHNWKLLHFKRASEREADIAEAKLRQTQAQFKQMEELLLFGPRYELALKKTRQEMDMLDIGKETAQAQLMQMQIQNMMAQVEFQKAQLELQQMMKELGFNTDGDSGNGNGAAP